MTRQRCKYKVAYHSGATAKRIAKGESRRTGDVIRAYACTEPSHIGVWHMRVAVGGAVIACMEARRKKATEAALDAHREAMWAYREAVRAAMRAEMP